MKVENTVSGGGPARPSSTAPASLEQPVCSLQTRVDTLQEQVTCAAPRTADQKPHCCGHDTPPAIVRRVLSRVRPSTLMPH